MKFGLIITQTDPETVFNALRLALYSLQQGDQVRIFFLAEVSKLTRSKTRTSTQKIRLKKSWMQEGNSLPAVRV